MSPHIDFPELAPETERPPKLFTPEEATRSLVLVGGVVADVVVEHSNLLEQQELIDAAGHEARSGQVRAARASMLRSVEKLRACMKEMELIGAELLDWFIGMVDFPCVANGREIRLCWQVGEEAVEHWHEVGQDCGRRRRIDWVLVKA